MTLTPPPTEPAQVRRRQRRDPDPHFKPDTSHQLDAILGCPAESVPKDHLAWAVLEIVEQLDTSAVEAGYSSLGRHGYHPKSTLAVWVYASLIGLHHSTKVARALGTDAAMRLVARGGKHSGATLRRFRQRNAVLFAAAIDATVRLAHERGLLDAKDLAIDSVRIRAHASTKAVRTRERSTRRLRELEGIDPRDLPKGSRMEHAAKLKKHREALALCDERDVTNVVLTSPAAALMKFPSGAGLPGHRVTVTASGQRTRFVISVLVDAATNDYGKLEGAVNQAREALLRAGVPEESKLQFAADAGYWSEPDLSFALRSREWADILVAEPGKENGHDDRTAPYFGRRAFEIDGETAVCPAGTRMRGPYQDSAVGRLKWIGVGCAECPQKPQCTPGRERALTVSPAAEAMRDRLQGKGARERYNRRIATVEPVFSAIEDTMGFRRVSSRLPETVRAEILLKILAHNVGRLVTAKRVRCVYVLVEEF
ncbi:transposase IS4 family protein [Anaeromyxobacter sp. K]|uniref:IS1182-like element ISAnsp6 family transposase n=1 Tax=Anaeromyxobacter sp. (strain K) TaxID=447217 RepID=UPI00015F82D6|nr:IS1182-like element ISAnsp6 family transposase [Anaeromyxobacter sp. K]ACG72346.1 transposase IS4 family protein [Anaeromyxobacter sp. K]ACG73389.1 transposase IS4 family protein [Anaeromyxobacter sp. K]ACG73424.1 transposase IS4 family protein [Anaeromyxobacter sp. K]